MGQPKSSRTSQVGANSLLMLLHGRGRLRRHPSGFDLPPPCFLMNSRFPPFSRYSGQPHIEA